jgi:hypothetical protein
MASNYSTPAALKQSFDARLRKSNQEIPQGHLVLGVFRFLRTKVPEALLPNTPTK